ncbi:GMC family oxidoreductase [Cephaloticoccus primus]|uniref:GMC family oxidoreductase n=1 Tax=Cephaloticoccus primus TaxID=1548207 RepID=A0A139SPZ1_9BACT|nr:GMC family oxidoreductase [Cephaloticoccus primus]KXU36636.1 GMC family oxidoreductase [Cephaloticoccus primus]
MANEKYHYDAIVVGSGITGGWAAKELTEKGLRVLMLERGRNIEHVKDYVNAWKEAWDLPHRGRPTPKQRAVTKGWLFSQATLGMWVDERDSPYTETKPFRWVRGYHVGGRSLLWGRQSYRMPPMDFEANAKEGIAIDWPIRYKDLAPWYDYVERFAGIAGTMEGLDEVLPDGQFLPPIRLNAVERDAAAQIKRAFGGTRHLINSRVAHVTEYRPEQGRAACQLRNKCNVGCPYGAYFSTQSATLPAAMKTGRLTLRPFSIVKEVLYDKDRKRARGVEIIDAENGQTYQYTARVIFINAGSFNSTWLLMNSATDVWEGGLGSSSGELGHNAMDHHSGAGGGGQVEGYLDSYVFGRRPVSGFYVPRFRNVGGDKRDYLRGFGYQGGAGRGRGAPGAGDIAVGPELKEALSVPGNWNISMGGFGEMLPYYDNKISLDPVRKDKWGLPILAIDVSLHENELAMRKDMKEAAQEFFEAIDFVKNVGSHDGGYTPGNGIHEMGTARMGRDPKTSVLNAHNQVWDAPNVYVTDGACMTSSGCVNPSLTYMAITARAADHAVRELKARNL